MTDSIMHTHRRSPHVSKCRRLQVLYLLLLPVCNWSKTRSSEPRKGGQVAAEELWGENTQIMKREVWASVVLRRCCVLSTCAIRRGQCGGIPAHSLSREGLSSDGHGRSRQSLSALRVIYSLVLQRREKSDFTTRHIPGVKKKSTKTTLQKHSTTSKISAWLKKVNSA